MNKKWIKFKFHVRFAFYAIAYLAFTQYNEDWKWNKKKKDYDIIYTPKTWVEKFESLEDDYMFSYPYQLRLMSKEEFEYEWEKLKRDVGR